MKDEVQEELIVSYPLGSRQKEMENVEISPIIETNSSRKKDKTGKKKKRENR